MLNSMLDTDFYKLGIGQLVFNQFPDAMATYKFINRNNTRFPYGFADKLKAAIKQLATLKLTNEEFTWLSSFKYFKPTYLEWFKNYQYNPKEVEVFQDDELSVLIHAPWYRAVYWEVPLMAIISELYFVDNKPDKEWKNRLHDKIEKFRNLHWADFGTRRRFSQAVHKEVVETAVAASRCDRVSFLGTSNAMLAMNYKVRPIGTTAHEGPMAMQVIHGASKSNIAWMDAWIKEYHGELGIALPDTLTTEVFLRDFDSYYARVFDGVRQDSGDPAKFAYNMIEHYRKLGINPRSKKIVFSDGLTPDKVLSLHEGFNEHVQTAFGIGTNMSCDVGVKPLNMVIKLIRLNGKPCVKLSDTAGKYTGDSEAVQRVKNELARR